MSLNTDGYIVRPNFLHPELVQTILSEYNTLFNNRNSMRDRGFSLIKYDASNDCRVLKFPELYINSVNLLELSINIGILLNNIYYKPNNLDFRCTGIECRQDSGDKLSIHSDKCFHRLRAYIYLTDATDNMSGELQYVPKTNHIDWSKINQSAASRSHELITCNASPGDLVVIDINGLHASTVRKNTRKVIIFEYDSHLPSQPSSSTIVIPANKLTQKIQENSELFSTSNASLRLGSMSQIYHSLPLNIYPNFTTFAHLFKKSIKSLLVKCARLISL
jgi:hypothetical protein